MVSKNLGDVCVTDIWVAGSQSDMETHACKYGSLISCLSIINRALKMGMVSTHECN